MVKKSDLLRQFGWDEKLINHFVIEDSEFIESEHSDSNLVETYDSKSVTITYNAELFGTSLIKKTSK